ncbi:MAG: DNA polymerase III subunit alpha, partial [Gemmatimonadales bacterium]
RARARLQDVLVAIRNRSTLDGAHGVRRPNHEFYLRSPGEMAELFHDRPDAIANTVVIARRCERFNLCEDLGYFFPDFRGQDSKTASCALAELSWQKLEELYPPSSPFRSRAERRLKEELALIELHKLCGFFLVYRDLLDLAREVARDVRATTRRAHGNLLPGRGRGSSVSSIVCYFLGLSHIDPIANNLFLGRFLNESLASVPDIDLDFPREIREELIRRVYQRYGNEHVGLVCTFPTYRLKSAVREVGKALDLPLGELEQVARLADRRSSDTLQDELRKLPGFDDKAESALWRLLCDLVEDIHGLPRHISQHVGGMIISSKPLIEIVPLELSAMPDRVLCQWDKDSCDDARFIKIDFLALGMLSLVEEAVELIARKEGSPPDLSRIDFTDSEVYNSICSGDTVGLFQIESRGQIQMIKRTRPRNLDDLSVEVAIVRPGPIVGGAVNPYVRRREEQREARTTGTPYLPPVDHPLLRDALGETLGVILYQDQVLQVCQALAGFSAGQAEALRRAMSRRRSRELMESFWNEFRDGAAANDVPQTIARKVFEQVVAFSAFGFPKSHAAAFGLLAYQSAWLRYYHPVEYYVALFNNQPMGFYSLDALCRDADRHGIEVLLPDINRSDVHSTVEDGCLRIGLGFTRGWGWDVTEQVIKERESNGSFECIGDLIRRSPARLSRDAIENLIWVGGCDTFGLNRRELIWQVGLILPPKNSATPNLPRKQLELALDHPYRHLRFGGIGPDDCILAEYDVLGFAATGHPFSLIRDSLPHNVVQSSRFASIENGTVIEVAGLVVARQRPETARGVMFILMEDEAGMVNAIVRPQIYEKYRVAVRREPFLWIKGELAKDGDTYNVIAYEVEPLEISHDVSHTPLSPSKPASSFLKKLRSSAPAAHSWY